MGIFGPKQQMQIYDSILPLAAKNEIMSSRLPQLNTDNIFLMDICTISKYGKCLITGNYKELKLWIKWQFRR